MLPGPGEERIDPGKIEASFDRLDLLPADGDLDGVGMDRVDRRPDLRQRSRIIAAVVGLRAEDQERRIVDEQLVPAVALYDSWQRRDLGSNVCRSGKQQGPKE